MIRINLPVDFECNVQIQKIYTELCVGMSEQFSAAGITMDYNGQEYSINSDEQVKEFLLSKDFYKYTIRDSQGLDFCLNFMQLPSNLKLCNFIKKVKREDEKYAFYNKVENSMWMEALKKEYDKDKTSNLNGAKKSEILESLELAGCYSKVLKLRGILNYNKLESKIMKSAENARHYILSKMKISVCPYCNMNYTLMYKERNDKKRILADLDHFYPKRKHPLYALCLYNFIPSCPTCNSRLKGSADFDRGNYIYPHENGFGDSGRFEIKNLVDVHTKAAVPDIGIRLLGEENFVAKVTNSNKLLCIEELYKNHAAYASNLLEKATIYTEGYLEEIDSLLSTSTVDMKQFVFDKELTEEELLHTSLGKLKKDLLEQFGVY